MTAHHYNVIVHVPHSSISLEVPDGLPGNFLASHEELRMELSQSTDWYTDDLFHLPGRMAGKLVFNRSRLLVDVERFLDDDREPMATRGRGLFYRVDHQGRPMRGPTTGKLRDALLGLYCQHHATLKQWTDSALEAYGRCLILDAHSFPATAWPLELDPNAERPDICIGTDTFHTPGWLAESARSIFESAGLKTAFNRPYAGTMVPLPHLGKSQRVHSLMVEVNRRLYLNEPTAERAPFYEALKARLQVCLARLIDTWLERPAYIQPGNRN